MTTHRIPRKGKTWIRCLTAWSVFFVSQLPAQEPMVPYTADQLAQVQKNLTPRFVPGSDKIVYINDASGAFEVWQVSASAKPSQLTSVSQNIAGLRVSADGSFAMFAADSGGNERFDIFRWDFHSGSVSRLTQTPTISERNLRISPDATQLAIAADPDIPFRSQIYVLNLKTGIRTQLTRGEIPARQPVWSHRGKIIAAVKTGDGQDGDLLLIKVLDKEVQAIKPPKGGRILWPLAFSPDDQFVLCKTKNKSGFYQLALLELRSKATRLIGPDKWDITEALWNAKAGIVFARNVSGRTGIYRLRTPAAELEPILQPSGVISGIDISAQGDKIIYTKEGAIQSQEIFLLELASRKDRQLTHSISTGIDSRRLALAEPFALKSFDGTTIEGFAYKPSLAWKPPYPAVAIVHGGPDLQDLDDFNPIAQVLAQSGFMVFRINYRGSTGYGDAFMDLDNKDWGGGDRKDIRAVLDHFIKKGLIDRNRIGIAGGSFGGYLTLMALVKDSDFYAAGVDGFGMPDLVADYEMTKDQFGLWYETEMGNPSKDSALFRDRSPIHYLHQLSVPLIVFHGANDNTVPKKQSDTLVETLRSLGRSVEYIVYPDEGHGFTRRPHIIDFMNRIVNFFRQNLVARRQ